jgi:hypothetical protein
MSEAAKECQQILDDVKKKSPIEQDTFRKGVRRWLIEIPMALLLKDVQKEMTTGERQKMYAWVMGVPGADKPDFVIDEPPSGGAEALENVRIAVRRVIEATPA